LDAAACEHARSDRASSAPRTRAGAPPAG
jgi:hypothetical protein